MPYRLKTAAVGQGQIEERRVGLVAFKEFHGLVQGLHGAYAEVPVRRQDALRKQPRVGVAVLDEEDFQRAFRIHDQESALFGNVTTASQKCSMDLTTSMNFENSTGLAM